jgi:hypothetical protein
VVVVKTTDGTEHTFHYPSDVTVHGRKDIDVASKDTLHGLTEGSEVAVHYSVDGTKETAHEIDSIGKDGLKTTKGLVSHVDGGAQEISIKAEDGNELTFRLTDRAAKDTSRAIVAVSKSHRLLRRKGRQEDGSLYQSSVLAARPL